MRLDVTGRRRRSRAAGGRADVFACDVADPVQVEGLKEHVTSHFGSPQILFNGAGLHCELVPIRETTRRRLDETADRVDRFLQENGVR